VCVARACLFIRPLALPPAPLSVRALPQSCVDMRPVFHTARAAASAAWLRGPAAASESQIGAARDPESQLRTHWRCQVLRSTGVGLPEKCPAEKEEEEKKSHASAARTRAAVALHCAAARSKSVGKPVPAASRGSWALSLWRQRKWTSRKKNQAVAVAAASALRGGAPRALD
jgi:hypothetical protein